MNGLVASWAMKWPRLSWSGRGPRRCSVLPLCVVVARSFPSGTVEGAVPRVGGALPTIGGARLSSCVHWPGGVCRGLCGQEIQWEWNTFRRGRSPEAAAADAVFWRKDGQVFVVLKVTAAVDVGSPVMAGLAESLADFRGAFVDCVVTVCACVRAARQVGSLPPKGGLGQGLPLTLVWRLSIPVPISWLRFSAGV